MHIATQAGSIEPGRAPPDRSGSSDLNDTGRQLGHDMFRCGRVLVDKRWPAALREGHAHARAQRANRHRPDRFERKWLQLRLQAYQRSRVVDEAVTPMLLERIDVDLCPVTRKPLTHGLQLPTDWSIDRLNNDGAYAPNNLAVISTRANAAKGRRTFEEVLTLSRLDAASDGLSPEEWLRLAGLMLGPAYATQVHLAPTIPFLVCLPRGLAITGMQQVQHVFVSMAGLASGKNALVKHFRAACPSELSRQRVACLAEVVHESIKGRASPCDAWLAPDAMVALKRWRDSLDGRAWAVACEISRQLVGGRIVDPGRVRAWHLDTRGYAS